MSSFQLSLKGVFGGGLADTYASPQPPSRPWPIFNLITSPRPCEPPEELAEIFDSEILPRLVVAHSSSAALAANETRRPGDATLNRGLREAFIRIVLSRTPELLGSFIRPLIQRGISGDEIYAKLLAPAAKMLIDLWGEDVVSYMEVTIGLGRLQQLVHGLENLTCYNGENDPECRSAIFTPAPGEQQTFGFYIIEEMFRWAGWRTWVETRATLADIDAAVRCQWFDMLCLSVTRDFENQKLSGTIRELRRVSRNENLFVIVNGQPFAEHPHLVGAVGADAAASSGGEALTIMDTALGHCH